MFFHFAILCSSSGCFLLIYIHRDRHGDGASRSPARSGACSGGEPGCWASPRQQLASLVSIARLAPAGSLTRSQVGAYSPAVDSCNSHAHPDHPDFERQFQTV